MNGLRLIKVVNGCALVFAVLACVLFLADFTGLLSGIMGFIWVAYILVCLLSYAIYPIWEVDTKKVNYGMASERFKKGMVFIAAALAVSIIGHKLGAFEEAAIPYIIIYLVSSVILLRTLRNMEYNDGDKRQDMLNLKYTVLVLGLSFFLSVKMIREAAFRALSWVYNALMDIFLFLFSWVFYGIGYLLQLMISFLKNIQSRSMAGKMLAKFFQPGRASDDLAEERGQAYFYEILSNSRVMHILVWAAAIILIVFITVRIFRRHSNFRLQEEEYTESREFIREEKAHTASKKATAGFNAGEYAAQIRHYYQRFLKMCVGKGIDIKNSDTTLEISKKSVPPFDPEAVTGMREIYVKVRYGGAAGDRSLSDSFRRLFKGLKEK